MNNKHFGIVVASISFGITCLLLTALHIVAYKQVIKENTSLKQENIEYKWEIEQVPYIIEMWCNGE